MPCIEPYAVNIRNFEAMYQLAILSASDLQDISNRR